MLFVVQAVGEYRASEGAGTVAGQTLPIAIAGLVVAAVLAWLGTRLLMRSRRGRVASANDLLLRREATLRSGLTPAFDRVLSGRDAGKMGVQDVRKTLVVVVLCLVIAPLPAAAMQGEGSNAYYSAPMDPGQETEAVESDGVGVATVTFLETTIGVRVITYNLEEIVAAHIHCAGAGEDGPVGVTLFSGDPVTHDGILVDTNEIEPDPGNECGWQDIIDVGDAIQDGEAYFNVHTTAYPAGEIRGQIPPELTVVVERFDDVELVPPHGEAILVIAADGVTLGCNPPDNNLFCPLEDVRRGQMAAFLRRGLNLPESDQDFFTDDTGSVFEEDINAIAAVGITQGCTTTEFCPNDPVRRDQMASFLARALGLTEGAGDDLFTDDDGNIHEAAIDALATAGITEGCTETEFCPSEAVQRDQMASFVFRSLWVL